MKKSGETCMAGTEGVILSGKRTDFGPPSVKISAEYILPKRQSVLFLLEETLCENSHKHDLKAHRLVLWTTGDAGNKPPYTKIYNNYLCGTAVWRLT